MNPFEKMSLQEKILRPIEIAYWITIAGIPALVWAFPLSQTDWRHLLVISGVAALFILILFHFILPRYPDQGWLIYPGTIVTILFIALYSYLLEPYGIEVDILYLGVIACVGTLNGKNLSLGTTLLAVAAELLVSVGRSAGVPAILLTAGIQAATLALAGYLVSHLTGAAYQNLLFSGKKTRYLTTLLQTGIVASRSTDLKWTLSQVAEIITHDLPVTTCQICLLDPGSGHSDQAPVRLITYGSYPIRPMPGWKMYAYNDRLLSDWPALQQILESGEVKILQRDANNAPQDQQLLENMFFDGIQSACLFPLVVQDKPLGIIAAGEARSWRREPFSRDKLELLHTLATQISIAIYNIQLYQESNRRAERLELLNQIGKTISSTLELDQLLELIYQQITAVIASDTYYVSLYYAEENILDLRILYDDGQRFAPQTIQLGHGFASWVIANRRPLLVRHLSQEIDHLPARPIHLGSDRQSESWLGAPMIAGDLCLGMIALASYTPNTFGEDDASLISSVAAQAALAVDNARQHAAVKEQARRDSLTQVYNHSHLLLRLNEEVEQASANDDPVSLIMMDIDYFKKYNDTYGHAVGDEVLRLLAQAIQMHVKKNDIVGRWGGEEFAITLPGATTDQAIQVAQRIRATLAELALDDRNGNPISGPTISQGIATYPTHASDAAELVDVADRALYLAKELGRDQVRSA